MVPSLAADVDVLFPESRFAASLANVLYAANSSTVDEFGQRTAGAGVWDFARARRYVIAAAQVSASQVISGTRSLLTDAVAADDLYAAVRGVFDRLLGDRLGQWAESQTTFAAAFGTHDAAVQNRMVWKQWRVTSGEDRHAAVDGERVELGVPFSNGLRFPGDVTADASETAWCHCLLDVGR